MSEQQTSSESENDVTIETDDDVEVEEKVDLEASPPPPPKLKRSPRVVKEEEVIKDEEEPPKKRRVGRPTKPKAVIENPKPKKKASEAQLAALAKGRAKRDAGRLERKTEQQKKQEARKQRHNELAVKKAIRIRKKEVMEDAVLMLSSEDDMDELEVKQVKRIVAKQKAKAKAKAKAEAKKEVSASPPVINDAPPQFIFY